ncbi:hypothetical protein [Microvirga massiliensis]|uniref:hypothetical protein n=1 Tax=Microvirga massiliensis TaxID=1033741 RepID=UPI00062B69F9|nr:hypothetical protein [Microvirga massiliensis]
MPKKNDNIVGQSEGPIVGDGHQTKEQAAIVQQEGGGLSDAERSKTWSEDGSGHMTPSPGGSSGGHSDQLAARGPRENRKVAGGLYDTERRHQEDRSGRTDDATGG